MVAGGRGREREKVRRGAMVVHMELFQRRRLRERMMMCLAMSEMWQDCTFVALVFCELVLGLLAAVFWY